VNEVEFLMCAASVCYPQPPDGALEMKHWWMTACSQKNMSSKTVHI